MLCGSPLAAYQAAELLGLSRSIFRAFRGDSSDLSHIQLLDTGPDLTRADLNPQRPTRNAGRSQLAAINEAFALVKESRSYALVTAPVSKARIASCGLPGAKKFRGHTEWLEALDAAKSSTMCFAAPQLATTLVTTHVPLRLVARKLTASNVAEATTRLARFLIGTHPLPKTGNRVPRIAVCSLNPHAGESELLGFEESSAIIPGIRLARRRLRKTALVEGPIGAETAYRKAYRGHFDGVVAMYHDQATIPMKLVAFGQAVNVTLGLSRIRTSVDHGTAYDIAWQGKAEPEGMTAAIDLALQLLSPDID